jgi:hypothetical protein
MTHYFMRFAVLVVFVLARTGYSAAWLCEEEASQRRGTSIYSCGIGTGGDEATARSKAFDAATLEFSKICDKSDDCKGRKVSLDPQRTDCRPGKNKNYKCYRLIVYRILDAGAGGRELASEAAAESKPIKKGFTKKQLYSIIGEPAFIVDEVWMPHVGFSGVSGKKFLYRGTMCKSTAYRDNAFNMGEDYLPAGECAVGVHGDAVVYVQNFVEALPK